MTQENQIEHNENALKLYSALQVVLELCTTQQNFPELKHNLKNKLRTLSDQLEPDIRPYINKIYEIDEDLSQAIGVAIQIIIENSIKEIVDRAIEMSNLAETN
jgi:hypothetical protein